VDFWWDSFPTNTGNCWYLNRAAAGRKVSTSPGNLPSCGNGTGSSVGLGSTNEVELVGCFGALAGNGYDSTLCPWFTTPPRPGSARAARQPAALPPAMTTEACAVYGTVRVAGCPQPRGGAS
jgi:hypothetical protein